MVITHQHLQRVGITVEAQIVRVSQQSVMSKDSNGLIQREHQAFEIVRFTLKDNTSFEAPLRFDVKSDINAPRIIGSRVMVAYDPDNPQEVIDISTVRAPWQGWVALGLGLMTGSLALFGLLIGCRQLWFASTAIKSFSLLGFALISLIGCRVTWQFWEESFIQLCTSPSDSETVSSGGLILTAANLQPFTGIYKKESLATTVLTRYHRGKRHGLSQTFIKGRLVAFETYHHDMRVGPFQHADDFGRKTAVGHFNGGHLDGDYRGFNPSTGRLTEKGRWRWGDKDGTWTYFHSNGSLALEEHYLNGQLEGVRKAYDEHGKLLLQAEYVQGELNGLYIKYWPNGQKALETTMAHGRPNGSYTTFHENGTVKCTGIMRNGQWDTAPTFYGSDNIAKNDEPFITILELTPEEARALKNKVN
ncbi:MORN repeat variant, partial [gut metagenome]